MPTSRGARGSAGITAGARSATARGAADTLLWVATPVVAGFSLLRLLSHHVTVVVFVITALAMLLAAVAAAGVAAVRAVAAARAVAATSRAGTACHGTPRATGPPPTEAPPAAPPPSSPPSSQANGRRWRAAWLGTNRRRWRAAWLGASGRWWRAAWLGANGRWWRAAWLATLVAAWACASAAEALLYPRRPRAATLVWIDAFAEPIAVVAGAALGIFLVRRARSRTCGRELEIQPRPLLLDRRRTGREGGRR